MNQNKTLPFQLCFTGCKRCCYHCNLGCQSCLISIKQCLVPCCQTICDLMKTLCTKLNIKCSLCQNCYQQCCGEICNCQFRCTNPFLIQDQIPQELFEILQNFDHLGEQNMFCYGNVHILKENIIYPSSELHNPIMFAQKIIDHSNKSMAKQFTAEWIPRLKQRFPHILQLQLMLQRQIDGFFSKQYRTYLFYDYILDSFQQEFQYRMKMDNYFSQNELLAYFLAIISGITYLQTQGINPSFIDLNEVYLTETGTIKLLDPSFYPKRSPMQQVLDDIVQSKKIYAKILKRNNKIKYYLAPEQLQEINTGNDQTRLNSCLFTLAIQIIQYSIMKNMDDCYVNYNINYELLDERKTLASQFLSIEFMMLLNQCLEVDPDQRISISLAYQQFIKLPDVQILILEMPKEFGLSYNSLIIQQDFQLQIPQTINIEPKFNEIKQQPQQQQQIQQPQQIKSQKNAFEELLKQKNYQIGQKQESIFTKILREKNYQFGYKPKPNVREQLELYSPQDSFLDKLDMYRQQPLILYQQQSPIEKEIQLFSKQQELDRDNQEYKYIRETYPNGCIYEGYKFNNQREGQGKYIHPTGAFYEGQWHNNKMEGMGKFYNNDFLIYDGEWKEDEYHGQGREYNDDPDNLGVVNYKNLNNIEQIWMTYQGIFKNDKREGQGNMEFVNGAVYHGEFRNGLPHGKGKYSDKDQRIIGQWNEGRFVDDI
ncbi:unnamed protein product [Paramecium pentaurelia]|uniref:Protein kinase domain-containing protein n=1 Tax=Paramecium pentaurelia TaxID=43138 RepID=A0A8S1S684_9CILI|nr:unnamed protein product [Paramecium pentaurelia]